MMGGLIQRVALRNQLHVPDALLQICHLRFQLSDSRIHWDLHQGARWLNHVSMANSASAIVMPPPIVITMPRTVAMESHSLSILLPCSSNLLVEAGVDLAFKR